MRVKVIINPAAGQADPILSVINDVFGPAGIEWDVAITHKRGDGMAAAREAAGEGYDLIGAYGGDGSVGEVVSGLIEGGPPILLLPGGTGNVLAEEIGIPPGLAEAAALAVGDAGEVKRVDVGRSGKRLFVLRLTTGFEADLVSATTKDMKERFGGLAYAIAGLQTISDASMITYSMTIDGKAVECEGLGALIANSAGTGVPGIRIADDVDVSDGLLDVIVLQRADLSGLIGSAADVAQGQQPRILSRWRGENIRIETTRPQAVISDGEDAGHTPVDVTVMPGAVGFLVPKRVD